MACIRAQKLTGAKKITGLIGKNDPYPVYFTTRFGIHTFGMKFPVDVLILDEKDKVVGMRKNLSPNRFYFWSPVYRRVIEIAAGGILRSDIKIGDTCEVVLYD